MTRYLILIHGNEARWASMPPEQRQEIDDAHRAFRARAGEAAIESSGQLEPSETAATLRHIAQGRPFVTDGPYAETEEVLGGFYVITAADRDEAISLAGGLAEVTHDHSWVEVWPLVDHDA